MSRARFRFHEELNDFLPPERRKVAFDYVFDRRASIKDVIEALGVPHPEVELILANGASVGFDYILRDGDRIAVYPVFEAFDISPALAVRPAPLRTIRFVLDAQLGTLARYLRICGFDTLYRNDYTDARIADISAGEQRILLTRDRDVLKRRIVTHGHFVRSVDPRVQLVDVIRRFDLGRAISPFTRCPHCNGMLRATDKERIADRLEPLTRRYYETFRICAACEHVYWRGSHFHGIERLIAHARGDATIDPAAPFAIAPRVPLREAAPMRIEPVDDEIWLAEGAVVSFYGFPYPTRMVLVRIGGDALWVWSPIALDGRLRAEVDALGTVRWLVSPNCLHHLYLQDWCRAYPAAELWAPRSVTRKRSDLTFSGILEERPPDAWEDDIDQAWFRGSVFIDEMAFFHRPSRTAIFADLTENFADDFLAQHWSRWQRWIARLWKITTGYGYAPLEYRLSFVRRARARAALRKVLAWNPERVIMAHGEWQRTDGRQYLERAFAWLSRS